jgi:hypothetical protein
MTSRVVARKFICEPHLQNVALLTNAGKIRPPSSSAITISRTMLRSTREGSLSSTCRTSGKSCIYSRQAAGFHSKARCATGGFVITAASGGGTSGIVLT